VYFLPKEIHESLRGFFFFFFHYSTQALLPARVSVMNYRLRGKNTDGKTLV